MGQLIGFMVIGVLAGVLSGLLGIGGGILLVPALVYLFGYSQHLAQGTTLALMVPPIGLLAAWSYYRQGNVNLAAALFIGLGFVAGGLLGARFAGALSGEALRRGFGAMLLVVGIKMLVAK